MSVNFDRTYRFSAGPAGRNGFEIGAPGSDFPMPLRVKFSCEKTDLEAPNAAKISIWNLNAAHIAAMGTNNCVATLRAGYGNTRPLIFTGLILRCTTEDDGADSCTTLEVEDSLIQLRDTYVSISYAGKINTKTILDDVAGQMGVAVVYSYNAGFYNLPNGFSYVGQAKNVLTTICQTSGLVWSLQNGILQVKKPGDTLSRECFILSADTGMIGSPRPFIETATDDSKKDRSGWEVDYMMNAAIGIDDYVYLNSKRAKGYFRVQGLKIEGDTHSETWACTAKLIAV